MHADPNAAKHEPTALRETVAPRRLGLRFGLTYAGLAALLFTLYAFPFELFGAKRDWLSGYLSAYARLSGGVLALFEPGVFVDGALIHGRFPLQIARNCDAIEINILFTSALLAYPAALGRKLLALALGLLALVALNVTRICSLYYIGAASAEAFELAHEEIFPLLLVAATALVFLLCAQKLDRAERAHVRVG